MINMRRIKELTHLLNSSVFLPISGIYLGWKIIQLDQEEAKHLDTCDYYWFTIQHSTCFKNIKTI